MDMSMNISNSIYEYEYKLLKKFITWGKKARKYNNEYKCGYIC